MPPLLIPALIVSTVVSTAVSIAGAVQAGKTVDLPEPPEVPTGADPEVARQRRAELVRSQARNSRATALSSTPDEGFTPNVSNATVLG